MRAFPQRNSPIFIWSACIKITAMFLSMSYSIKVNSEMKVYDLYFLVDEVITLLFFIPWSDE